MSVGGTGNLPNSRTGTGRLPSVKAAGKSAPKDGGPAVAPDEAVKRTTQTIAAWLSAPGKAGNPPDEIVKQVTDEIMAMADAAKVPVSRDLVEAEVKKRLKQFGKKFDEKNASTEEVGTFAKNQLDEVAEMMQQTMKGLRDRPRALPGIRSRCCRGPDRQSSPRAANPSSGRPDPRCLEEFPS